MMNEYIDNIGDLDGINTDEILKNDMDYSVMTYYLKPFHDFDSLEQGMLISNPFVKDQQKTPSFNIYKHKSGKWKYNDFATNDYGDVYDLVGKLYNLSFREAKIKISNDNELIKVFAKVPPSKNKIFINNLKTETMEEKKTHSPYGIVRRDENVFDRTFWYDRYGINRNVLNKYKVLPISSFSTGQKIITPNDIAYAYDIGNGYKIYQPNNPGYKYMYVGKKSENFIFGFEQLEAEGELVFITGGEKDVLTLASKSYNAITLNSETATLPQWLLEELKKRFKNIVVLYDNDETGITHTKKLCDEFNLEKVILPSMEQGKDVSDYVSLGYSLETLFRWQLPKIFNNSVAISSFRDLAVIGNSQVAIRKIWGCYVLENSLIIFPAERGIGKTFLMLELALMVANEAPSFCGEDIEHHGNVLYINLELSETLIGKRLQKLQEGLPFIGRYKAFCLTINGNFQKHIATIKKYLFELRPVLVIIDNMRAASSHIDNEKNRAVVGFVQEYLQKFIKEYNCAIILVHHTKKGTQHQYINSDMQSGAGALTDLADGDFFLGRSIQGKELRLLKRVKSRSCEEQDEAKLLYMNPDTLWFEVKEETVNESDHITREDRRIEKKSTLDEMRKLYAEGKTIQEIADLFGVHKSTVSRRLKQ